MKIYRSDDPIPVNSIARKAQSIIIPPFHYKGKLIPSTSDKWYPQYSMKLTGGYVTSTQAGTGDVTFTIYKNNIFETEGSFYPPTVAAEAYLGPNDTKALFTLSSNIGAAIMFTQYDWITVNADASSGHVGVTVQLYGERVN